MGTVCAASCRSSPHSALIAAAFIRCLTDRSPVLRHGDERVFALCGLAAAQMALRLVFVEHVFYLPIEIRVDLRQPLRYIFMYCGFGYGEFFPSRPHRRLILYNIEGQCYHSLFR